MKIIFKILIIAIFFAGIIQAKETIEAGNEAFKRGDYSKAIEYYKLAIRNKPAFSEYVNLGHCYMQLEQWDNACSAYEKAIKLDADAVKAPLWHSLGRAFFENRKYEQAEDAFSKASLLEPANDENDIWIARCMIELEQWIQVQSILLGRLSREPDNTVTLELLAYVYNQQENHSGIISIYRELLKIEPQNISYRVTLAKMLMNQGQHKQAIDVLEFARRIDFNQDTEINHLLADLYLAENMSREAAQCYEAIIKKSDKPSADDYYRLGLAYFQIGDFISSQDTFKRMEQIYPEDFRAELYLGRIFAEMEQLNKAQAYYSSAIKKNPESLESLVALSELQIKNKLYSDAAMSLAKAIELGDKRPQVYCNYIFALMKENNTTKIKAAIKDALALYPSDEKIRLFLKQYIRDNVTE